MIFLDVLQAHVSEGVLEGHGKRGCVRLGLLPHVRREGLLSLDEGPARIDGHDQRGRREQRNEKARAQLQGSSPWEVRFESRASMLPLRAIPRVRASHWIILSAAILAFDYATGPFIQLPIVFVFPVALATAAHGRPIGMAVAAMLPLLRLLFFLQWPLRSSWPLEFLDSGVDVAILVVVSALIERVIRQERELQVLEGMLPICSFCKRIRDEEGQWQQLEGYISARSSARFSHTFCRDCGLKQYPGLVD